MRLGISLYSYMKNINNGSMTLFDAIKSAKETGYETVEFITLNPPDGMDISDYAVKLKKACNDVGIIPAGYMVSRDFYNGSENDKASELINAKKDLDIAAMLGASYFRFDVIGWTPIRNTGYKKVIDSIAPYVREVAQYGESLGIKTMTENHGTYLQESHRMEYLMEKVDHPNYGICLDMGNFLCCDEDPVIAVGRLAPHAFNLHAKDFLYKNGTLPYPGDGWFSSRGGNHLRGTIVGHGVVPVPQCIKIMKNNGYTGDIVLEFEGLEDPVDAATKGFAYLSNIVNNL